MATFVLVPGAMHGSWCWERVVPLLEAAGHNVALVDLPGMGVNHAIPTEAVTLADWGEYVADVVRAQGAPVVLAGHSRGGLVIGEVAERVPALLAGLIYVTALLIPAGESVMSVRGVPMGEGPAPVLDTATLTAMFYNRCSPEDAAWACSRLEPEPMQMLSSAATITPERGGRVPRGYVECSDDAVIPLGFQRQMQAAMPCDPVVTLDCDHSPWLSAPEALAAAMGAMGSRFGA